MKARLPLLAAALVSLLLSLPASAGNVELFHETFDSNNQNWTYTSTGKPVYDHSWTVVDGSVYPGYKGVKVGKTTEAAHLKTGTINPINIVGNISITVCAAAYTNSAGTQYIRIDVVDSSDTTIVSLGGQSNGASLEKHISEGKDEIPSTGNYVKTFTLSSEDIPAVGGIALVFTSETSNQQQKRLLIGDVLVEQFVPALSNPAIELSGTVGANDFAVTWSSVANAEGYSVKLLDANDGVISSNDVTAVTTSASFTGLTSSSAYKVVVVALGNHTTTDDSVPATLDVTTATSAVAAPMLVVENTSWTAGVAGTSAVSATLEGDVACTIASVTMSDGSTATIANGTLSWTPPASNFTSSVTAKFHVTHGNDGWDVSETLSVAATPAPAVPSITLSNATRNSFDATWEPGVGGPVVEYKVRAWTGRATPDDATGTSSEMFSSWYSSKQLPGGWSKTGNLGQYTSAVGVHFPIQFNATGQALFSPVYLGNLTTLSFTAKNNSIGTGSQFTISGSDGNSESEFEVVETFDATTFSNDTAGGVVTVNLSSKYHQFKFEYTRTSGNLGFGSFSISGTDWPAADFLEGWGGAKVSVGTATSQTISNPVAGEVNWVEVTAVGPSGLETSARASISVPRIPAAVISVK